MRANGGSRDLSEYFIIVGSSKGKISFDVVSGACSDDHTATFSCLDRAIIAAILEFLSGVLSLFLYDKRSSDAFPSSVSLSHVFFSGVAFPSNKVGSVFRGAMMF